jgi:O-methyltransferase
VNRCYDLWSLVGESAKLAGCLIEVGVWRGGTGALIAKKAMLCGIAEPVYLCDTFTGVVKASFHDPVYRGGEHADASQNAVETLIKALDLSNAVILQGVFPEETSEHIRDKKIRFCHVDVDVYQSAKDIVEWTWQRLVVGGIVVFDDYGSPACEGIRAYVDELRGCRDRLVIINSNGHAIVVKLQ